MKELLLIRHAKSSWSDISLNDAERPLNDRGRRNATEMAGRLSERNIAINAYLSSPAVRTVSTAELFISKLGGEIIIVPELYLADKAAFLQCIINAPAVARTIAVFSHNSGITSFVNSLTTVKVEVMPTCGIFAVKCNIARWADFEPDHSKIEFDFFDYPKSGKE